MGRVSSSLILFTKKMRNAHAEKAGASKIAEIAPLVEHNLAKVGVASSSLVCRSIEMSRTQFLLYFSKKVFEYRKRIGSR